MDKEAVVHIHNGILLSYKKNAFESVLMRWMKLEPIIQSEFSSVQFSSVAQSCPTLCNPIEGSPPGSPSLGFSRQTSTNNKCCRGCGEKGTLLHCQWGYKLVQPLWRTVWRFLKKTGTRTAIQPRNPTARHTHRGNQNWKRHMYPSVHCITVYKS